MALRNRVTPDGAIIATSARGTVFGNRGALHDDEGQLVRSWQARRWLACRLEWKGRQRQLLQPHRYTELFFLDEATSLAAGHRPCAQCRHEDFEKFKDAWSAAHTHAVNADAIDHRLHHDRLRADRHTKRTFSADAGTLPAGAMVYLAGAPWLVADGQLLRWTPNGYTATRSIRGNPSVEVLTPAATVAVLHTGYDAATHPTARR